MHIYTVRKGESVRSLSAKFAVPECALARENPVPFYEGQRISVPVSILCLSPEAAKYAAGYYQTPETGIIHRHDVVNIIFNEK